MSLVIGEINYTNIMPMFSELPRRKLQNKGFAFQQAVPSQLNRMMAEGEVDIGGISSFEYAQNSSAYEVLPGLCVSSIGAVGSIFLFSRVPIAELDGQNVALTSSSATSVHLLKIILNRCYKIFPKFKSEPPDLTKMLQNNEACLLIGDDAIKASWENERLYTYDLGTLWYDWTGLPMTYALFAVRSEAARKYPHELQLLFESFHKSRQKNEQDEYRELTEKIRKSSGGSEKFWADYFRNLRFELTDDHFKGLELYFSLLAEEGYINKAESIKLWKPLRDDQLSKVDIT